MTLFSRCPSTQISAVVSDVDGTLVTADKVLTASTKAAVAELHARGIIFTIVSSRPTRGLRMLLDPLKITAPISGFNGGVLANPDLTIIAEHLLSPEVARGAVDMLEMHGVQVWVFAGQGWLARDPKGPYVGREQRTVGFQPIIVENFGPALDIAAKIVGISADFAHLAQCERDMRAAFAGQAFVACSQPYYLDITHPVANKGDALSELAKLIAIPQGEIAVIGDGDNDVAMFERSGLSIAMGNAGLEVQSAADFVTDSNRDDGFAHAIERFVLGGDRLNKRRDRMSAGDRA